MEGATVVYQGQVGYLCRLLILHSELLDACALFFAHLLDLVREVLVPLPFAHLLTITDGITFIYSDQFTELGWLPRDATNGLSYFRERLH